MKRHLITPNLLNQTEEMMQAIMDLRVDIIREGNMAVKHAEKSIDHICAAGRMLMDLKEKVGHGNFRKELDAIGMKKSTAANYMSVARYVQRGGHLKIGGLRDALKIISKGDAAPADPNPEAPAPNYQAAPDPPKNTRPESVMLDAEIVGDDPAPADDDEVATTTTDYMADVLALVPKLTGSQRQELFEILASRWNCKTTIKQ